MPQGIEAQAATFHLTYVAQQVGHDRMAQLMHCEPDEQHGNQQQSRPGGRPEKQLVHARHLAPPSGKANRRAA